MWYSLRLWTEERHGLRENDDGMEFLYRRKKTPQSE